jgi:hypothetical protein
MDVPQGGASVLSIREPCIDEADISFENNHQLFDARLILVLPKIELRGFPFKPSNQLCV